MEKFDYDEDVRNEIAEQILEAVENLALMTQREFVAVREDLREEFHGETQNLRNEMQAGFKLLYTQLHEEIEDLRKEMRAGFATIHGVLTNHEFRLERIEKKLDIS